MERSTPNSEEIKDNCIDNLKHRISQLPLVHKTSGRGSETDILTMIRPSTEQEACRISKSYTDVSEHKINVEQVFLRPKTAYGLVETRWICRNDNFPSSINDKNTEFSTDENGLITRSLAIPSDVWLIGGNLGSRNAVLVFRSSALACSTDDAIRSKPAFKLHITYKVLQAETKLLSKLLDRHGFTEVPGTNQDFNLLWTGSHPKPSIFRSLGGHQRVNHFPRSYELTRKDRLYKNIESMQHTRGVRNFDFIPQTFIMPGDYKEFCGAHYRVKGPWIVKPVASSRGRGIFIVETPNQVPLDEPVVVAKYITRPLLVDGHKCDLRLYVVVTSYDPLLIYIYEEGLVRFATVKYDTSHKQLWNPCMHLCNYSINKYHSDYVKSDDPCAENVGHKWTLSALLRNLKSQGKDTLQLMASIEDIVVKAILASANSVITACQMFVPNQNNCFELFGFDILIDEKLKPWLLEVNLSPSLGCDTPLDMRLKSAMLADLLTLVGLPAVDPILKPNYNSSPIKVNNSLKMKLGAEMFWRKRSPRRSKKSKSSSRTNGSRKSPSPVKTCRRVHSADGLSNTFPKRGTPHNNNQRLANSTLNLSPEEVKLVKSVKSQFERRGGWVRIFPTADSWLRYSQYLDPSTGIPMSSLPASTCSTYNATHHNYNLLLHNHLFADVMKDNAGTKTRHDRYERQLSQGHRGGSLDVSRELKEVKDGEDLKRQIVTMLKSGKALTQYEARKLFSHYLNCVLKRISNHTPEQDSHVDIVLKFLQKAASYLKSPFTVKVPSPKLEGKDRAAIVAKQLYDFLYMYNRETDLYTDTTDRLNFVPYKLFIKFLVTARESDLEEILTLQALHASSVTSKGNTAMGNWGFQGLLKCLPNVGGSCTKVTVKSNATSKKCHQGIKVSTRRS